MRRDDQLREVLLRWVPGNNRARALEEWDAVPPDERLVELRAALEEVVLTVNRLGMAPRKRAR
ncbi:MAG TPA: hypothetical protein VFS30_00540 [Dehalococcoidia bacterium]|nr:hypothetical protein [Dehalococcoidia bacterium]